MNSLMRLTLKWLFTSRNYSVGRLSITVLFMEEFLRRISNLSKLVAVSRIIVGLPSTDTKLSLQLPITTVMARITYSTGCWTGPS